MQELERQFKADGGRFVEYGIGELFDIHPTNAYKLTNSHIFHKGGKYPVVTNSSVNNGVTGYSNLEPTEKGNMITYSDTTTSEGIFYQPDDFVGYSHVQGLYPKKNWAKWDEKTLLYFVSLFRKSAGGRFDYANKFNRAIASDMLVSLPSLNDKISFPYMESVIRELQDERICKLTDYLKESGLENTEFSQEEKDAVLRLRRGKVKWKEYKIGDLFDIHPTNAYKLTNSQIMHSSGGNPVVTNSSVNNGITGYSCLEPTEKGNIVTYSDTTTSEGIFYQPDDFVGYPHVQGLYPKKNIDKWNEKTLLFFVSLFRKSAGGRFDYANKFNRAIASKMIVVLPITCDGEIDWDFMQNLITAISRLAIRGVVKWMNKSSQVKDYEIGRSAGSFAADPPGSYGN